MTEFDITPDTDPAGSGTDISAAPDLADTAPASTPGTEAPEVPATLVHVDPGALVLEANVRADISLDKAFVGSIRDHGVLVPIVAWRAPDGQLRVRMGQRRTLGAVEAGRQTVPVYVVDAPDEGKAAQVARIVVQLIENIHRAGLRPVDEVRAHQQLSLLGLRAGQIARQTRTAVKQVKASLQVAGSEVAAAAMDRYDLSLEQAAVIAEFDGDAEAVTALSVTAASKPEQFAHLAQRLRDDRDEHAARDRLTDQLTRAGVRIIEHTDHVYGSAVERLRDLRPDPDATPGTELAVDAHGQCPGHAAYLHAGRTWNADEPVSVIYVCTDWRANGHAHRYAPAGAAESANYSRTAGTGGTMTEQQKAERRTVIANNKAWDSATTVRRQWLREFLARRSAPKDAAQWIAATLAAAYPELSRALEAAHPLAGDLLGLSMDENRPYQYRHAGTAHPIGQAAQTATAHRATMLTLAMLLGGLEQSTSKSTWRAPINRAHRDYLTTLQHWGYDLSDVEALVLHTDQTTNSGANEDGAEDDRARRGQLPDCASDDLDVQQVPEPAPACEAAEGGTDRAA